jgi:glutaredoxin 3
MQEVIIYTKPGCPYCASAGFSEIDILREPARRTEMISRAKGRVTVPQIFIGGLHVGGCDDLYDLEQGRRLDALLTDPVSA